MLRIALFVSGPLAQIFGKYPRNALEKEANIFTSGRKKVATMVQHISHSG